MYNSCMERPSAIEGRERMPIITIERKIAFNILSFEQLNEDEQACVSLAIRAQKSSNNPFVHAGAAAMAYNGALVPSHNDVEGEDGHAEQQAIRKLYNSLPEGEKKLKILAVAACLAGEELVREDVLYDNTTAIEDIKGSKLCGQCLSYIDSCTATLDRENGEDVEILMVAVTGQIIRAKHRDLLPFAWQSMKVRIDPYKGGPVPGVINNGK